MIEAQISRFIDHDEATDFDRLASDLVLRQVREEIPGSQPEWSELSTSPGGGWQTIPPIPASALSDTDHATASQRMISQVMQAYWRMLRPTVGLPILLLATADSGQPLAQAVQQASADDDLTYPVVNGTIDTLAVRSWLAARQRGGQPATIIATSDLADRLFRFLERRRLLFRLPAGSRLFTTVTLAKLKDSPATSLLARLNHLGLTANAVRHLLGVPTLTTPVQLGFGHEGAAQLSPPPHWVRYRTSKGRLVIVDLATTGLPACQQIGLTAAAEDDGTDSGRLVVQL